MTFSFQNWLVFKSIHFFLLALKCSLCSKTVPKHDESTSVLNRWTSFYKTVHHFSSGYVTYSSQLINMSKKKPLVDVHLQISEQVLTCCSWSDNFVESSHVVFEFLSLWRFCFMLDKILIFMTSHHSQQNTFRSGFFLNWSMTVQICGCNYICIKNIFVHI